MVPFNETADGKTRPSIVIGWSPFGANEDENILIVPAYTFGGDPSKARRGDIALSDPISAGLSVDSRVRCRRIMSLHPKAFDFTNGPLGSVTGNDLNVILTEVEKMFAVPQRALLPAHYH